MFENIVLRIYLGLTGTKQGSGEDYITRSFMLCTPHKILVG
jgi:hypothetical protein